MINPYLSDPAAIEEIKLSLRLTDDCFNFEVERIIFAALTDIKRVGIKNPDMCDPLIHQCVILYAKAYFGYAQDSEKYVKAYESLRNSLSLSGGYIHVEQKNHACKSFHGVQRRRRIRRNALSTET
ncbi:MAG: hypothetical protein LBM16_01750 [Clostridiales bacterium]|jgi:hypothetical protein|nr:hypothetical protein [Clostridiales bacterium]